MPNATLELSIVPHEDDRPRVTARFAPVESVARPGLLADAVPVDLDPTALLVASAAGLDPLAYGRALTSQIFAAQPLRDAWQKARAAQ